LKVKDRVPDRATVVCVLTGNGLKDPSTAIDAATSDAYQQGIAPTIAAVASAIGF
jgi:threonine synthase